MNYLGIEIGGTKLQLVTGDETGRVQQHRSLEVDPAAGAPGIRLQIHDALRELRRDQAFHAVGVGFGGPVDWKTGKICRSHQIEGWSEYDLAGWLEPIAGARVFVENDANTAAYGEAMAGAGLHQTSPGGADPLFYVTLGSGVGGGLVVNGEIYHGAPPGEAEIGHVRLDRAGSTVESRCSGWAVDARIRQIIAQEPDSVLGRLARNAGKGEARFLPAALAASEPSALRLLNEVCDDLAFGLSHAGHLLHPRLLVLGGGLSKLGEPLRSGLERCLAQYTMDAFQPGPLVVLTALGDLAVPVGGLLLAKHRASAAVTEA